MISNFKNLANFVQEMNSSNSTNHKVEVLKKYSTDPFIRAVLHYTYTPYKQYGITSANLKKRAELISPDSIYDNLFYLLDDLADRHITGHAAIEAANRFIDDYTEFAYLIYQVIDRNLETRATTTIINRVMPDLIPDFKVALAHDITKVKGVDITDGTYYISRKLDGVRCLTIVKDDSIKCFSRNGKEFETLSIIKDEIVRLGITNCVLDGEICMMNEDGSDDFQGILKEIQRKDHTIQNPKYLVFDILTHEEFEKAHGVVPLSVRLYGYRVELESSIINKLEQIKINSDEELVSFQKEAKDKGWEGLIARRDVGYEGGRSKNMLKLKEFYDAEYEVVGIINGPQRIIVNGVEVEEEVLSAIVINHKGGSVDVGSGFSLNERREYYNHPEKILNSIVTVQYFEETIDKTGKNSLRFPVFKCNHGKTRTI